MSRQIQRYGWRPDTPDARDHFYMVARAVPLPPKVDLSPLMPPVYDQGELGSCTGNAIAAAIEYNRARQKLAPFTPSRLFIYYNERDLEGTVAEDAGAEIHDGIKSVVSLGACSEVDWPYNPVAFAAKPSDDCYANAKQDLVTRYARVMPTLTALKQCLVATNPICFGFTVYEDFESDETASTGIVALPGAGESIVGGHAVVAVGYDDAQKAVIVRNSWGPSWGRAGYFLLPYDYITNPDLADDFWTIQAVGGVAQPLTRVAWRACADAPTMMA